LTYTPGLSRTPTPTITSTQTPTTTSTQTPTPTPTPTLTSTSDTYFLKQELGTDLFLQENGYYILIQSVTQPAQTTQTPTPTKTSTPTLTPTSTPTSTKTPTPTPTLTQTLTKTPIGGGQSVCNPNYIINSNPVVNGWEARNLPCGSWEALSFGGGNFVALSSMLDYASISSDGVNWTQSSTLPIGRTDIPGIRLKFYNGVFYAILWNQGLLVSNNYGIDWSFFQIDGKYSDLAISDNLVVVVGLENGFKYANKTNLSNWQNPNFIGGGPIARTICYGNGKFVALQEIGAETDGSNLKVMTSSNGIDWTTQNQMINISTTEKANANLIFGNGVFVASPTSGNNSYSIIKSKIFTSNDGLFWSAKSLPTSNYWKCSNSDESGSFVVIQGGGLQEDKIAVSTDSGNSWNAAIYTDIASVGLGVEYPGVWNDICYGNGYWLAIGKSFIKTDPTPTPTSTFTGTPTITPTKTPTLTLSNTLTSTPTQTYTQTFTRTPTRTSTPTLSPTNTTTSGLTSTPTPTLTLSNTLTSTPTPTMTPTRTNTPTLTSTVTPTLTSTPTQSPTITLTPTLTSTQTLTKTVTSTPTTTSTITLTKTPTPTPNNSSVLTFLGGSSNGTNMKAIDPSYGQGIYKWYAYLKVGSPNIIDLSTCSPGVASFVCNVFIGENTNTLSSIAPLSTSYNGAYYCDVTYAGITTRVYVGTRNVVAVV